MMVRKNFREGDEKRDAGLTTPDDIRRFDDIHYGANAKWQKLDLYRPKDAQGKLPVIISVHGGACVYGDKERYQFYCMSLAQHGFAVVNFTYRLAPEYKFPAPLEDTNLVSEWVMEHAQEYQLDTQHIFAVGDSAGGHMLGLYAAVLTNKAYAAAFDFQVPTGFSLQAIALNCGVYKIELTGADDDGAKLTRNLMKDVLKGKGTAQELQQICVPEYITDTFPPTFLMTATGDFLKDQAMILLQKLTACNVPLEFHFYAQEHATQKRLGTDGYADKPEAELGHVFHCNMKLPEAARCNQEECDFFHKFC